MLPRVQAPVLPPPPSISAAGHALFIDFDGTLVPIVDRPDHVRVDADLVDLLGALHDRLGPRLSVISGRSIAQLDRMIGPVAVAITLAGSHGAELRYDGALVQPARADSLDIAEEDLRAFAADHPGTLVEAKSFGVALHYRLVPDLAIEARGAAMAIAERLGLVVQPGKMMIEIRGSGCDKGGALAALMARPALRDCRPVAVGDDLTDESAFAMAGSLGGFGVLIGSRDDTVAYHALADVPALRAWLWQIAEMQA